MNSKLRMFVACAFVAAPWASPPAFAQGRGSYLNVESPQVSPLALANVGSRTVLLVCNTPNNSLEVWDTNEGVPLAQRLLDRVRVGLEPISVHVHGDDFWVANFLGDSITAGELVATATGVRADVKNTVNVGDEPMDIAYYADGANDTIFVTLNTQSAVAWLDGATLLPRGGVAANAAIPLVEASPASGPPHGLKEPHAVRVFNNRLYVLALKGGVSHASSSHDLDVLSAPLGGATLAFGAPVANLGSTNFNMRFSSTGQLWAVGGEALNFDNQDKLAVRNEPSGFVQSTLYRVFNPTIAAAPVHRRDVNRVCDVPVNAASAGALAMPTDLAIYEVNGVVQKVFVAAFSSDRIGVFTTSSTTCSATTPTTKPIDWTRSVIAYPGTPVGNNPRWGPRGMVIGATQSGTPRLYVLNRLDNSVSIVDPVAETFVTSFAMTDPTPAYIRNGRPFLYSADISGNGFVSCASCHTDGRTDGFSWKLGNPSNTGPFEPAPAQSFIASLAGTGSFSSGGVGALSDPEFLTEMFGFATFDPDGADDKREMVTQSLQGLSNFEVAFDPSADSDHADLVRRLFHNGPFHWRGDKPSVREFNEAFVTLLLGANVGTNADSRGLTAAQMDAFETFIHSIHYPPNPKQPRKREFSAAVPATPPPDYDFYGDTNAVGSTSARGTDGLVKFHQLPLTQVVVGNRSCVHCHSLPEGSNNRLTVFVPDLPIAGYIATANRQPIESAALRGLFQKEPLLEIDGSTPNNAATSPVLGHFGLNHNGIQPATDAQNTHTSINLFVNAFFPNMTMSADAIDLKQVVHEFDWNIAPMVGSVLHVTYADFSDPARQAAIFAQLTSMMQQARVANAGLVVWGQNPTGTTRFRGWRYSPSIDLYVTEPPTTTLFDLSMLAGTIGGPTDTLTFLSVPLGSERRVASITGIPGGNQAVQFTPANVTLLGLIPDTAYDGVPSLRDNWIPATAPMNVQNGAAQFQFAEPLNILFGLAPSTDDVFAQTLRLYQYGLLRNAPLNGSPSPNTVNANDYGLPNLRHEAPRRFRVAANDVIPGARLLIDVPFPALPLTTGGPTPFGMSQGGAAVPTKTLELPLYPTSEFDNGRPVWETAVELDPLGAYMLMLGGPRAPGVQETIDTVICQEYLGANCALPPITEPSGAAMFTTNPFLPDTWNWYRIRIRNPGPTGPDDPTGPIGVGTWQQLVLL